MRRSLLALLMVPLFLGQSYNVPFNPPASGVPAWQTPVTDNFNRGTETIDASGDWTIVDGGFSIVANEASSEASALALWDTNTLAAKQCACAQRANAPTVSLTFCGPGVRFDSLTSTSDGYIARWTTSTVGDVMLRRCADVTCPDIEVYAHVIEESNWLCLCVDGAGSATEFAIWERTTDPSAEDPTDWGDADRCVDDDGSTVLWTDCTVNSAWDTDPVGNFRDCGGDACYAGIYSGGTPLCEIDNWSAREYK